MPPKAPIRIPRNSSRPPSGPPSRAPTPFRQQPIQSRPPTAANSQSSPYAIPTPPPPKANAPVLPQWLLPTVTGTLTVGAIALFVRDNMVCIDEVHGSSMAPTLSPLEHETGVRDRVVIMRGASIRQNRNGKSGLERNDVVTFWKPHGGHAAGTGENGSTFKGKGSGGISIKRIIGMPGDKIVVGRGYAVEMLNGRSGADGSEDATRHRIDNGVDGLPPIPTSDADAYFQARSVSQNPDIPEGSALVTVPRGHIWVEGDNWRRTFDSRDFGPISMNLVDGKAVRVWKGWGQMFVKVGDERAESDKKMGSWVLERADEGGKGSRTN